MASPSGSRFWTHFYRRRRETLCWPSLFCRIVKSSISIPRAPQRCCRAPPVSALTNGNAAKGEPNELIKPYPMRIVRVLGFAEAIGYDRHLDRQVGGR